jgi:hypothetical protein
VDNENPVAPEVLEDRAKNLLTANGGTLGHFVQSQRQNYGNGITDFVKTTRSYPDFDVAYMNIQGRHEIITINLRVDVRRHGVVEEEKQDELCVAVFHDGNQVSYAPMSELDNPTGNASRRILNQSNWGTDILPTCQLNRGIYSPLANLSSGKIFLSDNYFVTTSELNSEIMTNGLISRGEYPIMNCRSGTVWVASATVNFDDDGGIISYFDEQIEIINGKEAPAFAIDGSGSRYGFITNASRVWDSFWRSDYNFDIDSLFSRVIPYAGYSEEDVALSGQDNSVLVPGVYFTDDRRSSANWYYHKDRSSVIQRTMTSQTYGVGERISLDPGFAWVVSGGGSSSYSGPIPFCNYTNGVLDLDFVLFSETGESFTAIYDEFETATPINLASTTVYLTHTYGARTESSTYTKSNTGAENPARFYTFGHLFFPYAVDGMNYYATGSNNFLDSDFDPAYSTLVTPYGQVQLSQPAYKGYRGWAHVSNAKHLLQGFECEGLRYLYLDRGKITSLLGVPVESIQTVLFDIPRSKIEQFQ